jgi:hypothetical protein
MDDFPLKKWNDYGMLEVGNQAASLAHLFSASMLNRIFGTHKRVARAGFKISKQLPRPSITDFYNKICH